MSIVKMSSASDGGETGGLALSASTTAEVGDVLLAIQATDYYSADGMTSPYPGEWSFLAVADYGVNGPHIKAWASTVAEPGDVSVTVDSNQDASNYLFMYHVSGLRAGDAAGQTSLGTENYDTWEAPSVSGVAEGLLVCAWLGPPFFTTDIDAPPGMIKDAEEDPGYSTSAAAHETLTDSGPTGERYAHPTTAQDFAAVAISLPPKRPAVAALRVGTSANVPSLGAAASVPNLRAGADVPTLDASAQVIDNLNYYLDAQALGS